MENIFKNLFKKCKFKEYDLVELTKEDEKYTIDGVHKGDKGCIMKIYSINDAEVDFSGIDENGNFYGDCIPVKLEDLKLVEKEPTK